MPSLSFGGREGAWEARTIMSTGPSYLPRNPALACALLVIPCRHPVDGEDRMEDVGGGDRVSRAQRGLRTGS